MWSSSVKKDHGTSVNSLGHSSQNNWNVENLDEKNFKWVWITIRLQKDGHRAIKKVSIIHYTQKNSNHKCKQLL